MSAAEPIAAYPLAWPANFPRTQPSARTRARFGRGNAYQNVDGSYQGRRSLSVADGIDRILHELSLLKITDARTIIVSTNVELRRDGFPLSNRRAPEDPGAAVYWMKRGARRCMAIDRYDRVADNLGAIAATLEAMRAIDRHGGAEILDRAFTGFVALAAPEQWFQVLGLSAHASRAQIEEAYRRLAMLHHPDREGGDSATMARINSARDDAISRLSE